MKYPGLHPVCISFLVKSRFSQSSRRILHTLCKCSRAPEELSCKESYKIQARWNSVDLSHPKRSERDLSFIPKRFSSQLFRKPLIAPVTSFAHRKYSNGSPDNIMMVFDRKAKKMQRNKTAGLENYEVYDYIKEEMGYRMYDRICDVKRKFNVAVDLGCGRGHVSKHILEENVGTLYMCDHAEIVLEQAVTSPEVPTHKLCVDEELLPFNHNSLDLLFSSLSLHWVNDLPGTFKQIHNSLKPDGAFIGSMFGGETLFELRVSLQLAELEREGGFAPHISPFTDNRDLGSLLNRAGFTLLTIDVDELVVNYPSMYELMWDLKGMGESNCALNRKLHLSRDTTLAAAAIYKEMYGNEDGTVPATFHILHFIGWKPDPSQPKVAKRGSGQISIKDLGRLDEIMKEHPDGIDEK